MKNPFPSPLTASMMVISLFVTPSASAAEIHVAPPPMGDDSNPGSADRPFASINHAATLAKAGDTVWIHPGTYQPEQEIRPANSGTQDAPITFRAKPGGEVILDGQLKLPLETERKLGIISLEDREWIVVDGLSLINSRWAGVLARRSTGITVQNCSTLNTYGSGIIAANSSRIRFLHNTVRQACVHPTAGTYTDECITLASVNDFEIAHNKVSDRLIDSNNGGEGIDVKNACRDGSIHNNVVHDLVRLGIYCDSYEKDLSNVSIHSNTVYNCRYGIVIACEEGGTVRGVRVHDNLVYDCPRGGIRVAGYLRGGVKQDIAIYQNTVVRIGVKGVPDNPEDPIKVSGILIDSRHPENHSFVVRNNLLSGNVNQIDTAGQSYLTIERNLLHGPSKVTGTDAILADPLFVNAAENDFRLTEKSPAIDAATGQPKSPTDRNGTPRSEPSDLGAFEWSPQTP
ncbi:MAG: right-handed parallel beta-helix repeat-containing protein [Akkermansiaceae bacterium]